MPRSWTGSSTMFLVQAGRIRRENMMGPKHMIVASVVERCLPA